MPRASVADRAMRHAPRPGSIANSCWPASPGRAGPHGRCCVRARRGAAPCAGGADRRPGGGCSHIAVARGSRAGRGASRRCGCWISRSSCCRYCWRVRGKPGSASSAACAPRVITMARHCRGGSSFATVRCILSASTTSRAAPGSTPATLMRLRSRSVAPRRKTECWRWRRVFALLSRWPRLPATRRPVPPSPRRSSTPSRTSRSVAWRCSRGRRRCCALAGRRMRWTCWATSRSTLRPRADR